MRYIVQARRPGIRGGGEEMATKYFKIHSESGGNTA